MCNLKAAKLAFDKNQQIEYHIQNQPAIFKITCTDSKWFD